MVKQYNVEQWRKKTTCVHWAVNILSSMSKVVRTWVDIYSFVH